MLLQPRSFIGRKTMRLDKYLKVSRLIKRRTVANEACDAGRVLVNSKPARASYDVKVGDLIEIGLGSRRIKVKVLSVSETVRKEQASDLYQILSDEPVGH
jgi:ribosomal 50S subunit-recycling heat shock protein